MHNEDRRVSKIIYGIQPPVLWKREHILGCIVRIPTNIFHRLTIS